MSSLPPRLLSKEPAPITELQSALTRQHLLPILGELEQYLLAMRVKTDQVLAPQHRTRPEKMYPKGCCLEISLDVAARLKYGINHAQHPVETALHAFVRGGGIIRPVWGALRDKYFQNAFQFGALYVDVSNDTVVITKPKVEILPMADSGLVAIADLAHFARIAERYWEVPMYANHMLPVLSPLFPMMNSFNGVVGLYPANDYMIEMVARDGFADTRQWLATRAPLPAELAEQFRHRNGIGSAVSAGDERAAALAACEAAAKAGAQHDAGWRDALVAQYVALR